MGFFSKLFKQEKAPSRSSGIKYTSGKGEKKTIARSEMDKYRPLTRTVIIRERAQPARKSKSRSKRRPLISRRIWNKII